MRRREVDRWPCEGFRDELTGGNRSKEAARGTGRGTVRLLQIQSGVLDGYTGFPLSDIIRLRYLLPGMSSK